MNGIIIGVDGGGTKTRLTAVDAASGKITSSSQVNGINACTLGVQKAAENLADGIRALNLSRGEKIIAVSIGNPAIDDETDGAGLELEKALSSLGVLQDDTKLFSRSDVFMALYALSRGDSGALIVAGTGSMGVATDKSGAIYTVGGWGEPTRDDGSGNFIAVRGIEAAMSAFDGVAANTSLCAKALEFFGVEKPRDLIGVFNGKGLKKSETAAFSRVVSECAENGDVTAKRILTEAGEKLGAYAVSLLSRIGGESARVGIYGSVLLNCAPVREVFEKSIQNVYRGVKAEIPAEPPEIGAVYYAANSMGIRLNKIVNKQ